MYAAATHGLILALLSSVLFMILGIFGSRPFMSLFTDDPVITEMGTQYMSICLALSQGVFLAIMGERLLQATGNTFSSMLAQSTGALVNIALDPVLIFGLLGFPELGVKGAAIATVIGQFSAVIIALTLNAVKNHEVKFQFRGFRPDIRAIGGIYKVALPTMVVQTTASIMLLGVNKLLAVSTTAVALCRPSCSCP